MTYASQITRGEGKFRARLLIEGWPEIFVSDASLVGSSTETPVRSQILGLDPQTIRIAAQVDRLRAEMVGAEQTIEIVDDSEAVRGYVVRSGAVTASLSQEPTLTTYLTADLLIATPTVSVSSTDGWPSSGVLHVGTEAIQYTSKTATTFTGLTRSIWGTTTQAHYTGDGERLSFPHVTNRPRTLRGRRVKIYLYGASDTAASGGTLRWRAVARTDASYAQGRYSIGVEPASWIFEQPLGGDLEEPCPIRGIYLPSPGALDFRIGLAATGARAAPGFEVPVRISTSGYFVDNEALCVAINAKIATATAGWAWDAGSLLTAQSDGPEGWRLVYVVGPTTARYLVLLVSPTTIGHTIAGGIEGEVATHGASPVDTLMPGYGTPDHQGAHWLSAATGDVAGTMTTGQQYEVRFDAPVPRAVLGRGPPADWFVDTASTSSPDVLYLGGGVTPSAAMIAGVSADGEEEAEPVPAISADTTARTLTLISTSALLLGPRSRVRLARVLMRDGTLEDLLVALVLDSPAVATTGALPLLTLGDLESSYGDLAVAARALRAAIRTWVTTEGVTLKELITHEARLLGVYPCPDATGLITWKRLRPPLRTDPAAFTLDASTIGPGYPTVSRADSGHVREVLLRQGWDPIESEHRGLTIRVRDVRGADATPLGGVLEIAPRSVALYRGMYGLEIDPLDAELLAMPVLGLFGGRYRTVTAEVALTHFAATIGSVGVLTTALLPDDDGTMGLDQVECTLVGFDWSPFEGRGTLTLALSALNIGGYAPQVLVASQTNDSGNTWTITVTLSGYTTETDVTVWFAIGDEVRVMRRAVASTTIVAGTVVALPSTTSVQVTFDGVWTPSTNSWWLGYDTTAAVDEAAPATRRWAQSDFAKIGGTDARAALGSGDVGCQELSP